MTGNDCPIWLLIALEDGIVVEDAKWWIIDDLNLEQ